jgi:hypothetical protein
MSGLSREDALAALHWLVESGADEAIGELPVNRLLPPASSVTRQPTQEPPRSIERTGSPPVT